MDVPIGPQPENETPSMQMETDNEPLSVLDEQKIIERTLPDSGHPTLETKAYHWQIKNWKSLPKRITSPEFEVGGEKWRILLFPFGNNNTECLSIYLDRVPPKDPSWSSCAQFTLAISNPNDPTIFTFHTAHHRFTQEEADWGFTRFHELRRLFTPTDIDSKPIIENDSTMVSAYVRVVKDESGVLWHNFINYDSKKETGYVGLKNQGATCYMNSLLQSLYFTNAFRKAVYQIPTENEEPTKSVALALQRVFYQLQFSDQPVGTTELTKSFGWDSLDSFMQHDVQEFNRVLQDNLEGKMKSTAADGAIQKLFCGKTKSYIKCLDVDYESSRVENYYDIQLNVKNCPTLRDSFVDYCAVETLDGDNRYMAEGYGLQDAKKGVIFETFPPVLHLQLKRFDYDFMRDTMVKNNDRHEFPMTIDLKEFLSEDQKHQTSVYCLHGVLVHSGDLHGGHYYAIIRPEKNGKWFKFDDDRVIPVTEREVLEDNFGGEPPMNGNYQRVQVKITKRFTNAYMLVYINEAMLDKILSPVTEEDIPEHLTRQIEEEKAAFEARKREREEMHLFLNVKVLTDDLIKHHEGFDLAEIDDRNSVPITFKQYRVRRDQNFRDFQQAVSDDLRIPFDQFRFWVMVNRQNKTVRPDNVVESHEFDYKIDLIKEKHSSKWPELRLYLEDLRNLPLDKIPSFSPKTHILIFLKYFDIDAQKIQILGSTYVHKNALISSIIPELLSRCALSAGTKLHLYEEIKPEMIETLDFSSTFQSSEIQDGDIICFQKEPTTDQIDGPNAVSFPTVVQYFDYLTNKISVLFRPKFKESLKGDVTLTLLRNMDYDTVAQNVAIALQTDPFKLRFSHVGPSGTPKAVIKRNPRMTLQDLLQGNLYTPQSNVLFYEMLEVSILELETKKAIRVNWLGEVVKEETIVELLVPKNGTIDSIAAELQSKVTLAEPNHRIRFYEVLSHKIHRVFKGNESVNIVQDFCTLYAEEISQGELDAQESEKTVQVIHFTKEPLRTHGVPFIIRILQNETVGQLKKRLQQKLGFNDKDFAKVKLALVPHISYNDAKYLEEDDEQIDSTLSQDDMLGLDHVDRSVKSSRFGERSIKIFG